MAWPASLPQEMLLDSLNVGFPEGGAEEAPTDSGYSYQRQRFTAAPTPVTGEILVTPAQYSTLLTYWRDTLAHGTLPFDWKHPITGDAVRMQFKAKEPPSISANLGTLLKVSLTLRILP